MQYRYFIGEGEEAAAIVDFVMGKKTAWRDALKGFETFAKAAGFDGVWVRSGFMDPEHAGGVGVARRLSQEEERQLGVKHYRPMADGAGHAYVPRLSTKVGKALDAARRQCNECAFDHSAHITKETGTDAFCMDGNRMFSSTAGVYDGRLLIKMPMDRESKNEPAAWLREVKESEFLAAQGR